MRKLWQTIVEVVMVGFVVVAIVFMVCGMSGCLPTLSATKLPRLPALDEEAFFMRHAGGVGSVPAVTVTLGTLVWLIRLLFVGAAGAAVCSVLAGSVPVLGRYGAGAFGRIAAACAGTGVACLVLSIIIARAVNFVDSHPVLMGLVFFGTLVTAAGILVFGHRKAIERWTNIDWDRDGRVG